MQTPSKFDNRISVQRILYETKWPKRVKQELGIYGCQLHYSFGTFCHRCSGARESQRVPWALLQLLIEYASCNCRGPFYVRGVGLRKYCSQKLHYCSFGSLGVEVESPLGLVEGQVWVQPRRMDRAWSFSATRL